MAFSLEPCEVRKHMRREGEEIKGDSLCNLLHGAPLILVSRADVSVSWWGLGTREKWFWRYMIYIGLFTEPRFLPLANQIVPP